MDFIKESLLQKVFYVKTFSGKVVGHSLAYLTVHKGWLETSPCT